MDKRGHATGVLPLPETSAPALSIPAVRDKESYVRRERELLRIVLLFLIKIICSCWSQGEMRGKWENGKSIDEATGTKRQPLSIILNLPLKSLCSWLVTRSSDCCSSTGLVCQPSCFRVRKLSSCNRLPFDAVSSPGYGPPSWELELKNARKTVFVHRVGWTFNFVFNLFMYIE